MKERILVKTCITCQLLLLTVTGVVAEDRAAPVVEPSTTDIMKRLDNLERVLSGQGLVDMYQKLQSLQTEIGQLRGQIELQSHTLEQLKKRQQDIYADLDQRIENLKSSMQPDTEEMTDLSPPLETVAQREPEQSALEMAESQLEIDTETRPTLRDEPVATTEPEITESTPTDTQETVVPEPRASTDPVVIESEYQKAFKLLKNGDYERAIKNFENFLLEYPSSPYTDNAQYWLAEAFYVTQRYDRAIEEYNKLVSLHPESQKVTHSLLKMGYSHLELGQVDEAKTVLSTLRDHYPDTTAARLAEDRLLQLEDS